MRMSDDGWRNGYGADWSIAQVRPVPGRDTRDKPTALMPASFVAVNR